MVLKLSRNIEGHNYHLFFDNFFTTCSLVDALLEKKIYSCGTARQSRRDFPKELKGLRLSRGDFVFRQKGDVVATVWRDKRDVTVISSMTSPEATTTVERRQPDGSVSDITCPEAITTYNKYMNGVDRGDQLRNYYRVRLKCMKYYKYIFWFIFDVSITNAYILSSFIPTTCTSISMHTLKRFRLDLATQLIAAYCSIKRPGRSRTTIAIPHPAPPLPSANNGGTPLLQSPRMPLHLPSHSHGKRCVYCKQYRNPPRRRESVWYCSECPGQPTLCLTGRADGTDCYRIWHSSLLQ